MWGYICDAIGPTSGEIEGWKVGRYCRPYENGLGVAKTLCEGN